MLKKVLSQCCIVFGVVTLWGCTSNSVDTYKRDEDVQTVICGEYEVEMISCTYDEAIGLVECTFEIERVDGTEKGLDTSGLSWGDNDEYHLMLCATGQVTSNWEYDSEQKKKYIRIEQVARVWMSEEKKGSIDLYDNDLYVETFRFQPDEISSVIYNIDDEKKIYVTKNGLRAEGNFVFGTETELAIVYEGGETIDVFKDGRDNYEVGNWGGSSNVCTFILKKECDKGIEKIIYNGKEYK